MDIPAIQEGRDIGYCYGSGLAALDPDLSPDQTGRRVQRHMGYRLHHGDNAGLDRGRRRADGAVSAHVEIALAIHKYNSEVRFLTDG
ncbi:hypothetical protein SDC9_189444 [bioreactor metagenome]|uniref:Uncharacterized protein n=1 Tax=bioreactor metagenome TaxID=1076179 RepID=A0A645HUM3_9ZZZZ